MDLNRYTPVPPISASDDVDCSKEMEEQWTERVQSMRKKDSYDDLVTETVTRI